MSPSSVSYNTVGKVEHGGVQPTKSATTSFQFGIRRAEKVSVSALRVSKDSHRIRKPPLPLPRPIARPVHPPRSPVQYRAPIIIYTYSPEVIHTQPDDFMSLVQKLTGSCDTLHRLKRRKKSGSQKSPRPVNDRTGDRTAITATAAVTAAVTTLEQQQGLVLNCGSPSSSEDCGSTVRDGLCTTTSVNKQSNSPRGPLSNFEFDNTFAGDGLVKAEPVCSDSVNFCTGLKPLPKPVMQENYNNQGHYYNPYFHTVDINSPLPSPGFNLSPGLFAGLPELSPGTAAWSQQFLDCLNNGSPQLANQPPLQRQRSLQRNGAAEGTMVALENLQPLMLT